MRFVILFKGATGCSGRFDLRDICVSVVDSYALTVDEITKIVRLEPGQVFENGDLIVVRVVTDGPPRLLGQPP